MIWHVIWKGLNVPVKTFVLDNDSTLSLLSEQMVSNKATLQENLKQKEGTTIKYFC